MRASRLLAMLILLQLRGRLTAADLAAEFEVSVRTVYRDIDALSAAGVPVYGDAGPGGGFSLLEGYRTRLTGLDQAEQAALPLIGMGEAAALLGLGNAAVRARSKLLAAAPRESGDRARLLAGAVHVDLEDWYAGTDPAPHLPALLDAVLERRWCSMRYVSWTAERQWRFAPLGIVIKAGQAYCLADARGRNTIFRVAAMHDLFVEADCFTVPADFDLPVRWAGARRQFEAALRPETARLRVSAEGARRLTELGAYAARAVAEADAPDSGGWRVVDLPVEPGPYTARLLMTLGEEAEVLAPPALRAEMARLATAIVSRHCA